MSTAQNEEEEEAGYFLSDQAHVDYILTADFDVDAGPIISHQYPEPLGGDVRYKQFPSPQRNNGRSDGCRIYIWRGGLICVN